MKYIPSQLIYFSQNKTMRKNLRNLIKFLAVIVATITVYSILFHFIMEYEGKQFSWKDQPCHFQCVPGPAPG